MTKKNKTKYYIDSELESFSNNGTSLQSLRSETEFFDEEKAKEKLDVFRIKFYSKKSGDGWIVYKNNENLMDIKAYRLNKKEKNFFEHVEGIQFILSCVKQGLSTVVELKAKINDKLKEIREL